MPDDYFLRSILIIITISLFIIGMKYFNRKIEQHLINTIHEYFKSKGYTIKSIVPIPNHSKETPFKMDKWTPSTGKFKNYWANRYWKIRLKDEQENEIIQWVNTGNLFFYELYFIVKP